jgi:RHS repeat-associated protein
MLGYDQARLHIRGAEHDYTNPVDEPDPAQPNAFPDDYRTPVLASNMAAEMTGVPAPTPKAAPGTTVTDLYSYDEIDGTTGFWTTVWTTSSDIPYEQIPRSDIDGAGAPAANPTRRSLSHHIIQYRTDDLSALLPLGQLQPRALIGQSYTAALTPGQLSAIFGALVPAATLTEGGYVQRPGSSNWWIPSGRLYYSPGDTDTPAQELAYALAHFFVPCRAVDPFGATARAGYDPYALLATSATDRVGNTSTATPDYRVLAPAIVTDPNGNRVAVAFDVFGFPTATAVMGKTTETLGDLLTGFTVDLDSATLLGQFTNPLSDPHGLIGDATTRTICDLDAYQRTATSAQPTPPAVYTLARETHVSDLTSPPYPGAPQTTRYQYHFTYSDGLGRQIQTKTLVAPGPLTTGGEPVPTRWVGSGWTILDNKGRPVRKYEPFFTTTNAFEFAAQIGVSSVLFYDPPGRVVATLQPDNSWAKTVFDPWLTQTWDGDDTVKTDPTTDSDIGDYFTRFLAATAATFTSWYAQQAGGTPWQLDAAQKAATAAGTPTTTHADSLGRACLAVVDNGGGNRYPSRTAYDTEGTPLAVFDALGRRAEEHWYRDPQTGGGFAYLAGNDMTGNPVYHISADAGAHRSLNNVAGQPIRAWDARGHAFRTVYDADQRPTQRYVSTNGAPETLLDYAVYGEGQPAANLCGRLFRHYDTAGYLENTTYDYEGNLLSSVRQLALDYQQSPDWTPLAGLTTASQLDTTATAAGLIPTGDAGRDTFIATNSYDALNRPTQQIAAHNPSMKPDVVQPGYDQGAMLITLDVWLQQSAVPAALLDPATADQHTLTGIDYNARGQRLQATQGNGATTAYTYDPLTFRLTGLTTTRPTTFATNQQTVQDLSYYYDAVGNITHIQDDADTQDVIFFDNQRVEPSASYSYDPLYRLISATGREHLGQTGKQLSAPQQVTNDDSKRMNLPQPGDGNAMGTYTESYGYDPVGNILTMVHTAGSGGWTRNYSYTQPSQIVASETCNRLTATSLPADPPGGPYSAIYSHDPHGNMTQMPHLAAMTFDEDDRLRSTIRTVATTGITPQTTYYCYDSNTERIRKVTNAQTPAGQTPNRASERIYLGDTEIYREYSPDGTTITLERETLHLNDDKSAVALIETRTIGTDKYVAKQVRYQYGNHLGSAVLELDDQGDILTYEEYLPYGSTSYQAVSSQTEVPKRYRYTGKECDTENDLYYNGARYYAPWLGRWTACDPIGSISDLNLYSYVHLNPVRRIDPNGTEDGPASLTNDQISQIWSESKDYNDFVTRLGLGPVTVEYVAKFLIEKHWSPPGINSDKKIPENSSAKVDPNASPGPSIGAVDNPDRVEQEVQSYEASERHKEHPTGYDIMVADMATVSAATGHGDPISAGAYGYAKLRGYSEADARKISSAAGVVFSVAAIASPRGGPSTAPEVPAVEALGGRPISTASEAFAPSLSGSDPVAAEGIAQVEAFQNAIARVEARAGADPTLLWDKLSPGEQALAVRNPGSLDVLYGKAFEKALWDQLRPLGTFDYIARARGFPQSRADFADKPGIGYGLWYDTTTHADIPSHIANRWYGDRTVFGGYNK